MSPSLISSAGGRSTAGAWAGYRPNSTGSRKVPLSTASANSRARSNACPAPVKLVPVALGEAPVERGGGYRPGPLKRLPCAIQAGAVRAGGDPHRGQVEGDADLGLG